MVSSVIASIEFIGALAVGWQRRECHHPHALSHAIAMMAIFFLGRILGVLLHYKNVAV